MNYLGLLRFKRQGPGGARAGLCVLSVSALLYFFPVFDREDEVLIRGADGQTLRLGLSGDGDPVLEIVGSGGVVLLRLGIASTAGVEDAGVIEVFETGEFPDTARLSAGGQVLISGTSGERLVSHAFGIKFTSPSVESSTGSGGDLGDNLTIIDGSGFGTHWPIGARSEGRSWLKGRSWASIAE